MYVIMSWTTVISPELSPICGLNLRFSADSCALQVLEFSGEEANLQKSAFCLSVTLSPSPWARTDYYQNSCQFRSSGGYLVVEVFRVIWNSNEGKRSVYWNATLSCPLMVSNYANLYLVPISFWCWSFLGHFRNPRNPISRKCKGIRRELKEIHSYLVFQACIALLRCLRKSGTPITNILVQTGMLPCLVTQWPHIMQTCIAYRSRSDLVLDADHSLDFLGPISLVLQACISFCSVSDKSGAFLQGRANHEVHIVNWNTGIGGVESA